MPKRSEDPILIPEFIIYVASRLGAVAAVALLVFWLVAR